MKKEMKKKIDKFKLVQTKVYQLNNLLLGTSSYVPVHFDREYASLCAATIHGQLIDFRFRVQNHHLKKEEAKDGDTFMENGILVEYKNELD